MRFLAFLCSFAIILVSGCSGQSPEVVIYTSLDQNLSEPILKSFEQKTGIRVLAVYDVEANKTIGLVNRLIAERGRPRCDVFWNSETVQTIALQKQGLLSAYASPNAQARAVAYRDPDKYWAGFAARARILLVNTQQVKNIDSLTLYDLTNPRWEGKVAIANPHFGSTGTHFSALYSTWGETKFRHWLQAMKKNAVAVLPGNAQVRDTVVSGQYPIGLTDTDDANGAISDGSPVKIKYPDQGQDGLGLFVFPNTVALIQGGPNPANGKRLIDFLLSAPVEQRLAEGRGAQIPLQNNIPGPKNLAPLSSLKVMSVNYPQLSQNYTRMLQIYDEIWKE